MADTNGRTASESLAVHVGEGLSDQTFALVDSVMAEFGTYQQVVPQLLYLEHVAGIGQVLARTPGIVVAEVSPTIPVDVTSDTIAEVVAKDTGVTVDVLRSRSRKQALVTGRHIMMHLTQELTGASLNETARAVGLTDHKTVMHGLAKVRRQMDVDPNFAKRVEDTRQRVIDQRGQVAGERYAVLLNHHGLEEVTFRLASEYGATAIQAGVEEKVFERPEFPPDIYARERIWLKFGGYAQSALNATWQREAANRD